MTRPPAAAWARATAMLGSAASMAVTANPRRAMGSATSPPPQPISSRRRPSKGVRFRESRPKWAASPSRRNCSRAGLSLWSGAIDPSGSHHVSASAEKRSISSRSMVPAGWAMGPVLMTFRCGIGASLPRSRGREYEYARFPRQPRFPVDFPDFWARRLMARIVQKFGGTSVADIARIKNVALRVKREVDAGNEVAVVVSAMAGATNQLVAWTREASRVHDAREYDVVVS